MFSIKDDLRSEMRKRRSSLTDYEVKKSSKDVCDNFLNLYSSCKSFLFYWSFDKEIQTFDVLDYLYKQGKFIYLPKITENEIYAGLYMGEKSIKEGFCGIMEPLNYSADLNMIDVAVVPGLVFDTSCNRIGFGKGFYDKLLSKFNFGTKTGFAYHFQVVDHIDTEEHDIPLDVVITEKNIYRRE